MSNSQDNAGQIDQHQKGVEKIQRKHTGAKSIIKIPERKIPVFYMVDDRCILHQILLTGIGSGILEHGQLIPE